MVGVIAGMTAFVLHSKNKYLPCGTLPFPTEVVEMLDVLVVTVKKISASVLHGGSQLQTVCIDLLLWVLHCLI